MNYNNTVTPYKRVIAALKGEAADKIPFTAYEMFVPSCTFERELRSRGMCIVKRICSYKTIFKNIDVKTYGYTDEQGRQLVKTIYPTPYGDLWTLTEMVYNTSWMHKYLFKSPENYGDTSPQYYHWAFNTISRLSKAIVPETTEIYPELEDFPHSRFSKSKSFVTYQIITSSILDSCGLTLNIFDMAGNGVMRSEGYQKSLADIKAFATRVRDLGLKTANQTGIKVLFDPCSSYTLQTQAGEAMSELYPEETF